MIILGINEDHNASCALFANGKILACASEERFTRKKNDVGYPFSAAEFVLKNTRIRPEEIDRVVFAGLIQDPVNFKIKRITNFTVKDYIRSFEVWE